jgi:hypothetical protein
MVYMFARYTLKSMYFNPSPLRYAHGCDGRPLENQIKFKTFLTIF